MSQDLRHCLSEVEARLTAVQRRTPPPKWKAESYVGGGTSKLKYLDLKIPSVRAEFKKGFSFSNLEPKAQWEIWDYIWKQSEIFEVMLMPSYWAAARPFLETFAHRKWVLSWLARVDNWAHSDELSAHYARFLEHSPDLMLPVFEKWNRSTKPWFKRQSMVGLLYYARFRQRKPAVNLILKFVERHIEDDHYYVQKGVGWTLRECWNVYPRPTYAYLKKNAARIPPAGWTAATEKLSPADKARLSKIRAGGKITSV